MKLPARYIVNEKRRSLAGTPISKSDVICKVRIDRKWIDFKGRKFGGRE